MKKLIWICLIGGVSNYCTAQKYTARVFVLSEKALAANKSKIDNKDALIMPAYKQLLKDADKALKFGPVSVMGKKHLPPSGDRHDYMSLAPYFWPDPAKPDGLPYIRKDGQTTPEVKEYLDKEYMPKLCESVFTLALSYYFSGEKVYADHAAKLMKVWFLDTATRMNPNLEFAQAIKGVNTGRGAGMIDSRHFVKLIDAIGLLSASKSWTKTDQEGMQKWFHDFLQWMQTSKNGRDEMAAKNNHGAWYDAQRLSMALFIDSADLAKKVVANSLIRLDKQMDEQGNFPLEMERTISLHYTVFALNAFLAISEMSAHSGADISQQVTPSGKSLKKAIDVLVPYLSGNKKWDGPQIKEYNQEESLPLLLAAYKNYDCKACLAIIKSVGKDYNQSARVHLLTDIAF
ncbi:MAG: alginate lyase family protein [Ferruginibacter sp.]|nr:alginate lyase family protein [Ferruginibacter sp.]